MSENLLYFHLVSSISNRYFKKMSSLVVLQHSASQRVEILNKFERTPTSVKQDIDNLKKWMEKQPHLPEIPCDQMLERFLISSKFHIEKVKLRLDMYYTVRSLIPEFYEHDPWSETMQKIMNTLYVVPLPSLTQQLQRIFIVALKDHNPENFDLVAIAAHCFHISEIRFREECALSDIYIYDMKGFTLNHMLKYSPTVIKKFTFVVEKVFPNKTDGLHFINAPPFVDSIISLISMYFKPKIADRVHVHKSIESLHKVIEGNVLPKEYGGQEESLEEIQKKWQQKFVEYKELFAHLRSLKVEEKLRPGKPLNSDALGIDGNFRQLNVD